MSLEYGPRQRRALELATPEQRRALEEFRQRINEERRSPAIECKRENRGFRMPRLR